MIASTEPAPGILLRDAALLALARVEHDRSLRLPPWTETDAHALHGEAGRQLSRQTDAVAMLGSKVEHLTRGIALVPFLEPGGAFGPAWPGHPFVSGAMEVGYRLREPDLTRALAALMGPGAGHLGQRRAIGFLRLLTAMTDATAIGDTLTDRTRPTVAAEHPISAPRRRALSDPVGRSAATRIDLLFEWPCTDGGRRAVVVIEAKLGATVSEGQLRSYRQEAVRRARGGPVALILLTAQPDAAERRHRAWKPVRWFALLRRWEALLAQAGDEDREFARVRAHLWRHVLDPPNKAMR